ncbi:MAG TPA: D-2-hydroxyacid dehydrogenase family protein [Usitatibacter sp.]|nr:D-2-hydroxyacid dehydrogenase family protein [Usitatibacter sp.]
MTRRARIVALDDYEQLLRSKGDWAAVDALADVVVHHERLRGEKLFDAIKDADAIVVIRDRTPFPAELLAKLPKLEFFSFTGGRNTTMDAAAFKARGIPVTNTAMGQSKDATAELAWTLILAAAKRLEAYLALVREGRWRDGKGLPAVLQGERLGIIGLGEIGQKVGQVGKAFGMELVCWSPNMTAERASERGARSVSLEELLQTSKVVSLHLVPSEKTRKLLNGERLALMRPDSILVNTARSALIDMGALDAALGKGRPGVAGLDVYDDEPLAPGFTLAKRENVVLTPHLGFVNDPVFSKFGPGVVENLLAWLRGEPQPRLVNAP